MRVGRIKMLKKGLIENLFTTLSYTTMRKGSTEDGPGRTLAGEDCMIW
jgi:hypothetical protein